MVKQQDIVLLEDAVAFVVIQLFLVKQQDVVIS